MISHSAMPRSEEERAMRVAVPIVLTPKERTTLERWARGRRTPARLVLRAKIVWRADAGRRPRFAQRRLAGIERDAPRPGRTPSLAPAVVKRIVTLTTTTPPPAATHWSTRTLAPGVGGGPKTVHRVWQAPGLKPHRVRPFKVSRDPRFLEKLTDVVGLYLNPPGKDLVLCAA